MDSDRIQQIQKQTAYPDSCSVMNALHQVWNEVEQEKNKQIKELKSKLKRCNYVRQMDW